MRTLWRGLVRTILWSYERGSWPYDLMVAAIVAFVLLTPRGWFHDQPQSSTLATSGVQIIYEGSGGHVRTYRLDAKLLAPEKRAPKSTPELEREIHDILGRTAEELKGHTFQVLRIDPVRGDDGSILYYDVILRN